MDFLRHLKRLGSGGRNLLAARPSPVPWFSLYNSGVAVAVGPTVRADEVRITLRVGASAERALHVERVGAVDDLALALAPLDPALFATPGIWTVAVTARGRTHRRRFTLGPGLFAGRIDGVRDYALEGWVSPLFSCAAPEVQLVVDGVAGDPAPLDRYRRELMFAGAQGGWNGFRLVLPPEALDGSAHRLAVRAGETVLDFGDWAAKPKFHIEAAGSQRLAGWYFDRATADVPATLRIVTDGTTRAVAKTHSRPDLKTAFGRDWASFAFRDEEIAPGSDLVAGPEGTGIVVGRIGDGRLARIDGARHEARALLIGADGHPANREAGLPARRAIRTRIVEAERRGPEGGIAFQPTTPSGFALRLPGALARDGADAAWQPPPEPPPVCAILPAYNGLSDLRACIASLLPQLQAGRARAIVIDDASPDPAVGRYLAQLAAEVHPGLTVLRNPENLGFIATVNRGFSLLRPGEDALLVNADTILPPGALERLSRHCHARPGIASVTPMSNNATILSFPSLAAANAPALGLSVEALDQAFAETGGGPVTVPTGVGFCMHINRAALDEAGPLSIDWGRGYCEEVDWCLTARDLGWIHLAATDVFVVHEGSVSFTNAMRLELLARNHARLEALYPEYLDELSAFARADPFEPVRIAVLARLLAGRFSHLTLHLTHGLGGGTKRYVDDLRRLPREPGHEVAILRPADDMADDRRLELAFDGAKATLTLAADSVEGMLERLEAAGVAIRIHVNSRLTYDGAFLARFLSGKRPYVVMLHDFQWYCPRVHLTDERGFYCGEPPPQICQLCVTGGVDYNFADHGVLIEQNLDAFLDFNARLLRGAESVLAPSQDTADRYAKRFGLTGITVLPHPEPQPRAPVRMSARRAPPSGALRVAVVGAIGRHKGFDLLQRMAERAARDRTPFFLSVVGFTPNSPTLMRYGNVEVTGSYQPSELKARLAAIDPDFVFLSSVWPETYSYVLSEIWDAGYPVVAFDFGAPAERIRAAGGGLLIPPTRDTRALLDTLIRVRAELAGLDAPVIPPVRVPTLEAYYAAGGAAGTWAAPA